MRLVDFLEIVRTTLSEKESAREELLKLTREMRINSTKAIAMIHAGDFKSAEDYLSKALETLERVLEYKRYPEIYYPITFDSMQELVEAYAFMHVVKNENLDVDLSNLKVEYAPILTGLADLVGELRRFVLDLLRKGDFEKSERFIGIMEEVYNHLITFNFPDRLTPGLRPKVDYVRNAIERTKSDFISAKALILEDYIADLVDILEKRC